MADEPDCDNCLNYTQEGPRGVGSPPWFVCRYGLLRPMSCGRFTPKPIKIQASKGAQNG